MVATHEVVNQAPRSSGTTSPTTPRCVRRLRADLADPRDAGLRARRIAERMALTLQAPLLVRHAPPAVAEAFCASRLGEDWGHAFGTLPPGVDVGTIVERARPKPS